MNANNLIEDRRQKLSSHDRLLIRQLIAEGVSVVKTAAKFEVSKNTIYRLLEKGSEKMIKRIHINQHNIKANLKGAEPVLPVVTVKTYNANHKGMEVEIKGPSRLIYSPDKPLSCGAKVWIETEAACRVDGRVI